MSDAKFQKIKLTNISGVIGFYKKILKSGRVMPNGSTAKRYQILVDEYASGKRKMKDLRVEALNKSNKATPVTKPAAAARSSKFLML
jgi:hypothetical protein